MEITDGYHSLGLQRARETLGLPMGLDETALREWINDNVKQDTLMFATSVDWWLGLRKGVGAERRRQEPPPSPFKTRGEGGKSAEQAERAEVEVWQRGWIRRLGVEAEHDALAGHVDHASKSMMVELQREHPWLVQAKTNRIVGFANAAPEQLMELAFANPEDLLIETLTLDAALRRSWFDRDERSGWIRTLKRAQEIAVDERLARFDRKIAQQVAALDPALQDGWLQSRRAAGDTAIEALQARFDLQFAQLCRLALNDFISR